MHSSWFAPQGLGPSPEKAGGIGGSDATAARARHPVAPTAAGYAGGRAARLGLPPAAASRLPSKLLAWTLPAIALMMLALTLMPAAVWRAPVNDAEYHGFDSNLIYVDRGGAGGVNVSHDSIDMTAPPGTNPTVNLTTSPMPKLQASADIAILANAGTAEPFRIGLWSPWSDTGEFIVFGPAPQNPISAETFKNGKPGSTLIGGDPTDVTDLGQYELGKTYRLSVEIDQAARKIVMSVTGPGGTPAAVTLDSRLFGSVQISLTASALGQFGTTHVVLTNWVLTLPHEKFWGVKVEDARVTAALVALALGGIALVVVASIVAIGRNNSLGRAARMGIASRFRGRGRAVLAVAGAIALYLIGNALLFRLGNHPFDMGNEKLYAYVGKTYSLADLYFLPNTTSLAGTWHGTPYIEAAFPYEPVSAYLHASIGWLTSLLFVGGGALNANSTQIEYVTKAANVAFGLADSVLICLILRQIRVSERWSLIAAALFMFNPAVWFSMSIWGQTHVFSLFLVLLAVLFAEKRMPTWAWLALAGACLTRPQMLVFGLLLGIVFLRSFSWRQNLYALSWSVVAMFVLMLPLTLATSPSLPVDIMVHNFAVQEAGGNVAALTTVSQDAYSIWPLVTYLAHGATGLQRAFTPSSSILVGSLTYQFASQIITIAAMLLVAAGLILRKRRELDSGGYLPLVAIGIASFLMLLTGIVATHFLLALPFLLLARRWMGTIAYLYVAAIWTVTTFVPMYGDLGVAIATLDYPLLSPVHNALTKFFIDLYAWDRFITLAVVANICGLIWFAFLAFRPAARVPEPA
jgi:hypothetical protein